jgi:Asp-tRNA(Asn)/Glu-tRNA(Gln) amidotransferase A subunit family amidase
LVPTGQIRSNLLNVLDRIESVDTAIEAFMPEAGRRERVLDEIERLPTASLQGAPLGVKDIFRVNGLPTTGGSKIDPAEFEGEESLVVSRLRNAGAIVLGKTRTTEFAGPHPTTTRNPHDTDRTPGGSSSGSAAAVASGLASITIGTQTIGSMMRPASYCGVAAFKTTHSSVPLEDVLASAPSYDSFGMFAANVAGLSAAMPVALKQDTPEGRADLGILAIPSRQYLERADVQALRRFDAFVELLRRAGFQLVQTDAGADLDSLVSTQGAVFGFEFYREYGQRFGDRSSLLGSGTQNALKAGSAISAADYASARRDLDTQRSAIDVWFEQEGIDAVLAPSATTVAPVGLQHTGDPIMSLPWSHLGLPSVSIPLPQRPGELPLGVQIVGPRNHDLKLLSSAASIETVVGHQGQRP